VFVEVLIAAFFAWLFIKGRVGNASASGPPIQSFGVQQGIPLPVGGASDYSAADAINWPNGVPDWVLNPQLPPDIPAPLASARPN
jgi:hypothetical protein